MGVIVKELPIEGNRGQAVVRACFDTGCGVSLLRRDIAERVAQISSLPRSRAFGLADGRGTKETKEAVTVAVTLKEVNVDYTFYVVRDLSDEMIIGADMLQRWKIRLDPESEDVNIDPAVTRIRV